MKKRWISILCLIALVGVVVMGCSSFGKQEVLENSIYYLNIEGTTLEQEEYMLEETDPEKAVAVLWKELKKTPQKSDLKTAIPKDLEMTDYIIDGHQLQLYFNEAYLDMKTIDEILCRAAIVQTLLQIDAIDYVDFFVGEEPLKDKEGNPIGHMQAKDFVQTSEAVLTSYQTATLTLYFADAKGEKLIPETINVRYNSNTSMEKLVIERLMQGPSAIGSQPVVPSKVKILGVSIKDGICYVNLDKAFLEPAINLKPLLSIYAITNSIIENGPAIKVQFSVEGETDIMYQGSVKLDSPFEYNSKMIKEEGK